MAEDKNKGTNHLQLVKPPAQKDEGKKGLKGEVVSFMPHVSGVQKRQEAKSALDTYTARASRSITEAIKMMQEYKNDDWIEQIPVPVAIEMYIMDMLKECHEVVSQSADPKLFNQFVRVVSTADISSKLTYSTHEAKFNYENFAPDLESLCMACGVQSLGTEPNSVISQYLPRVKSLCGFEIPLKKEETAEVPRQEEVVSFMPRVTGVQKRQEIKSVFDAYLAKAKEFVSGAVETVHEDPNFADDLPISIAIELYFMDKFKRCYDAVSQSADPDLLNEFVRLVSTASFNSRMVFLSDQSKRNFENIAPDLNSLCENCGVQHLGMDADVVVSAYLSEVVKLNGNGNSLKPEQKNGIPMAAERRLLTKHEVLGILKKVATDFDQVEDLLEIPVDKLFHHSDSYISVYSADKNRDSMHLSALVKETSGPLPDASQLVFTVGLFDSSSQTFFFICDPNKRIVLVEGLLYLGKGSWDMVAASLKEILKVKANADNQRKPYNLIVSIEGEMSIR